MEWTCEITIILRYSDIMMFIVQSHYIQSVFTSCEKSVFPVLINVLHLIWLNNLSISND